METTKPIPLVAANWKMNGLTPALEVARAMAEGLGETPARVAVCPPATLLHRTAQALRGSPILIGGQDCHAQPEGAFTGDVSAEMLADAGATLVILGHSERRAAHGETDEIVRAKALAALRGGLEPLVCVGETADERNAGRAVEIVTAQVLGSLAAELSGQAFAVAYEPTWAIGTGATPTVAEIEEMHAAIRAALNGMFGAHGGSRPILYGGSVKPSNAAEILRAEGVGGALVGGASLKAADFLGIVHAL